MSSFCRSGLLALTLVGGFMAAEAISQVNRLIHQKWASDVSSERLGDKSMLTEYFGETISNELDDVILRVGFIPRFGCAPLVTINFGMESGSALENERTLSDLQQISVSVDGASVSFPTLVDENGDHLSVYMNASLQRRLTAKLRIEVGSTLRVAVRNGEKMSFSLSGSRDAISIAHQNCRRHDPQVQG